MTNEQDLELAAALNKKSRMRRASMLPEWKRMMLHVFSPGALNASSRILAELTRLAFRVDAHYPIWRAERAVLG